MSFRIIQEPYPIDIRGIRTFFNTWAQKRTTFNRVVPEAALSHTIKDKAEAAYARSGFFEKRCELMSLWSRYITKADVIKFSGR